MKKIISLLLVLLMTAALCACGESSSAAGQAKTDSASEAAEGPVFSSAEHSTEPAAEPESLRLVFSGFDGCENYPTYAMHSGSELPELEVISVPEKEGFIFAGFYDSEEGGDMYYDSALTPLKTWPKEGGGTLYPHWLEIKEPNMITLTAENFEDYFQIEVEGTRVYEVTVLTRNEIRREYSVVITPKHSEFVQGDASEEIQLAVTVNLHDVPPYVFKLDETLKKENGYQLKTVFHTDENPIPVLPGSDPLNPVNGFLAGCKITDCSGQICELPENDGLEDLPVFSPPPAQDVELVPIVLGFTPKMPKEAVLEQIGNDYTEANGYHYFSAPAFFNSKEFGIEPLEGQCFAYFDDYDNLQTLNFMIRADSVSAEEYEAVKEAASAVASRYCSDYGEPYISEFEEFDNLTNYLWSFYDSKGGFRSAEISVSDFSIAFSMS